MTLGVWISLWVVGTLGFCLWWALLTAEESDDPGWPDL